MFLELVATPPPGGDRLAYLVEYMPGPVRAIEPAVEALVDTSGIAPAGAAQPVEPRLRAASSPA